MSATSTRSATAAFISLALTTSSRSTPAGDGRWTGPAIKVTSAPASRAASASANPWRPELRLLMKRTGSRNSRVGPAVTSTLTPARHWGDARAAITASAMSTGSSIRPGPNSPHACSPSAGPRTVAPSACSRATLRCVAGCSHILLFIAGARKSGAVVARHSVVSRSSAKPFASLARMFAVAGAMTTASAQRANSMWPIAASASASHKSVRGRLPARACSAVGVTNRCAFLVKTGTISASKPRRCLTSSADFTPAMPPLTPSRMCFAWLSDGMPSV